MNDNIEYLKDEIEEFEYLKDEIEELITDNYEDLKIKNIVISRNIFKETQIIITFKEAEKLLPELKRMLIFFDKNCDDYGSYRKKKIAD